MGAIEAPVDARLAALESVLGTLGRELSNLAERPELTWPQLYNRLSPDGTWVVSDVGDFTLKLWDIAAGTELRSLMKLRCPLCNAISSFNDRWRGSGPSQFGQAMSRVNSFLVGK
jgi:hypothetical protein